MTWSNSSRSTLSQTTPSRTALSPSPRSVVPAFSLALVFFLFSSFGAAQESTDPLPKRIGSRIEGDDWPTLLGPHQDGRSSETGLSTDWTQAPPTILWQREVGEGYAIGSLSLGRYVHFDRIGDQARVVAVNAETGEELWEFTYPTDYEDLYGYDGGPRCNPVIDSGRVYLLGVEGMLHCLSLADGQLLWKHDTLREYGVVQNFFGVGSTPVVVGDQLWVMIGGSPVVAHNVPPGRLDDVEPNGSGLVVFDKRTGVELFRAVNDLASYSSLRSATFNGETRVLAFARAGLWVVDPQAPENPPFFPWRARILESVNASIPVVSNDRILISETYGPGAALLQYQNNSLSPIWSDAERGRDKALMTHWNTPVLHQGFVYASSGRHTNNAELRCVELETGQVRWSVPRLTRCSLTYVDEHLLCLGEDGVLRLLKATPEAYTEVGVLRLEAPAPVGGSLPGIQVRRRPLLDYPCWAAPIVSHGLIYVRGRDRVVCLQAPPAAAE